MDDKKRNSIIAMLPTKHAVNGGIQWWFHAEKFSPSLARDVFADLWKV